MTRFSSREKPDPDAERGVNGQGQEIIPLEAALSQASSSKLHKLAEFNEQAIEERAKRAAEPVRMEGLKPLPAGTPHPGPGQIPGGPDALGLVPSVRRSIPAPFSRDRIDFDSRHHGKTWAYLKAGQVQPGDIVVDFGRVEGRTIRPRRERIAGHDVLVAESVLLINPLGNVREFGMDEDVKVFRVHDG